MLRMVDTLEERGHRCTMLTNQCNKEKAKSVLAKSGLKADIIFPDNFTRDQLI